MSSEISTSKVRLKPDTTDDGGGVRLQPDGTTDRGSVRLQPDRGTDIRADPGLQPWQFFVLAALGCATAVTFMARGQGPTAVILLGVLMGTAALVGYAALRTLRPLVTADEDRTVMVGQRTRVALEREKLLTLRAIKELEFDRAMGRLSDQDWNEMSGRLRVRAARLMRQLDAGGGYRDQIEKELAKRIESDARLKPSRSEEGDTAERDRDRATKSLAENRRASALAEHDNAKASAARRPRECASCETANDSDAKFCKGCGQPLAGG